MGLMLKTAILLVLVILVSGNYEECREMAQQAPLDQVVNRFEKQETPFFLAFFEKCIAGEFGFDHSADYSQWNSIPSFRNDGENRFKIGDEPPQIAAIVAKNFFLSYSNWKETIDLFKEDERSQCKQLLLITAARYVLYLDVLRLVSGDRIHACQESQQRYVYPEYACYPVVYGSLTCTSDVDIGLIGPQSGMLVDEFSKYFLRWFDKGSDEVMDTNVYSYSLEFTMPALFENFGKKGEVIDILSKEAKFQVQDLIFSLFQVYKFNQLSFESLKDAVCTNLNKDGRGFCNYWIKFILSFIAEVPLRPKNRKEVETEFWKSHQEMYRSLVRQVADLARQEQRQIEKEINLILVSHLYATEAYHSRGALRVVVGSMQMGKAFITSELTMLDYWCAMIEDWGNVNKVFYDECEGRGADMCLVLISKYLRRVFYSMAELHSRLAKIDLADGLGPSPRGHPGLEQIAKHWLYDFKKKGLYEIPERYNPLTHAAGQQRVEEMREEFAECEVSQNSEETMNVYQYFLRLTSTEVEGDVKQPLSEDVMKSIHLSIERYCLRLAEVFRAGGILEH